MERSRTSGLSLALSLLAAMAVAGCESPPQARTVFPALEESGVEEAAGYEVPPVLRASELLPAELLTGPHHVVEEEVVSDGFTRTYSISSDFGRFEARGDHALRMRLQEIEVLGKLREMSKSKEFTTAAGNAIKSPFVAAWNLITSPVDSITGVPIGAWRYIKRTSELARGERGELEDSAFREFIGFEQKKRELAHQLGVDPYSSNKALQRELNRFAWASYVGGFPSMLVPFAGDSAPDDSPLESKASDRLSDILLFYSPEDLRKLNRIELAVMGISQPLSEEFIGHPWYSPRHQTVLVESLVALDSTADRAAFLEVAVTAESEDDALFYQRIAELLRAYSENVERVEKIAAIGDTLVGYTENHALVVPLVIDHAIWTRPTAQLAGSFARPVAEGIEVERTEFLLSGTLSPKARAEIEGLGIAVTERAFERLKPKPAGNDQSAAAHPDAGDRL
jgi:hypothetical protein